MCGTRGGFELPGGVGEAGGAKGEAVVAGNEPAGVVQQAGDADGELGVLRGNDAAFPVVSNYTGELETKAEEIKANLVAQADHPVRWITCVKTMQAFGADTFVEAGPGKTLCGFNRRIDRSIKSLNVENLESLQKTLDYLKEVR